MATLISARDIDQAAAGGERRLVPPAGAIVTPAARDRAREIGVTIGPAPSAGTAAPREPGVAGAQGTPVGPGGGTSIVERRGQRSLLDFVAGLKGYNHFRGNVAVYAAREAAFEAETGRKPQTPLEALSLISDDPAWRTDQFVMNVSQDMLWTNVLTMLEPQRSELEARLAAAETQGPGRLELNPGLALPAYYTATEFHIMPGSYHGDPIAGFVLTIGGGIYFANAYDDHAMQWAIVESLPAGFEPRRILDLGCSTGTSTVPWKQAFPAAHVTGLDLAAPMVRYAHLRANELGLDVDFTQRLAESTGYPDGTFDLVTACILTHELPTAVAERVFAEAYRILAPGGVLLNGDIQPSRAMGDSSFGMLRHDFERNNNGEAYIPEILGNGDLPAAMRRAGFVSVEEPATTHARTRSIFPWVTLGWKPNA